MLATVSTLAENPTLKAALDTWQTERRAGGVRSAAVATVQNEVEKIASSRAGGRARRSSTHAGRSSQRRTARAAWRAGERVAASGSNGDDAGGDGRHDAGRRVLRVMEVPLEAGGCNHRQPAARHRARRRVCARG